MNDNKPIKTFREGPIGASIWLSQTSSGVFYDVTFSRCWKDETTNKFGYSQTFSDWHLQSLTDVIGTVYAWIALQKANAETVTGSEESEPDVYAEADKAMNAEPTESAQRPEQGTDQKSEQAEAEPLTPEQLADLWSPEKQEEYRRAYLRQQARRTCPGCGDDGSLF